jgi:hypothetical protein
LNLVQIGQILCRPDSDDTCPSILEKIVKKARLVTDLIVKKQQKFKDSNIRNLFTEFEFKAGKKLELLRENGNSPK